MAKTRITSSKGAAPRLAIFNHKGGVGKTTLTVNVAAALAELGKRVLLVDSDPQCNLTAYLIEEAVVNDLLDNSDEADGETLWSAVKPVVESTGDVKTIDPIEIGENLFLLPGDVRLAEFEQELHVFWNDCFQRKPRGFRATNALSYIISSIVKKHDIDYVFYDSGPNIGALNRAILLDCDAFVIPAACDLFSLRAITTLGHALAAWISDCNTIAALAPEDAVWLAGRPQLIGYVPQRFRVYRGLPAAQYAAFLPKLEKRIQSEIVNRLKKIDASLAPPVDAPLQMGEVKDFGSLATASQLEGVSVFKVSAGTTQQHEDAAAAFTKIAEAIIKRTD